jgi:hypothetical protein
MQGTRSDRPAQGLVAGLGVLGVAVIAAAVLLLLGETSYDVWGGVIVAPILVAVAVPALRRQAVREGSERIFAILLGALVLKLAAALVRHFVAFSVYGGVADAAGYDGWGGRLSEGFWRGDFATGLNSLSGTDFIRFLTGLVYTFTGRTILGGFLVFSWIGFWGLFLFYRAFDIAVPEGRRLTYAKLVFFLPSLLYWPSSIGKEAWMMLSLGFIAFGAARVLTGRMWRGVPWLALGLWFASIVRPHVAAMAGVALAAAFVIRRPRVELRQLAPLVKAASLIVVVVVASVLVVRTDRYLHDTVVRGPSGGVTSILTGVADRTSGGGSSFAPSIFESPLRAPIAAVTVVFRPLLVDATNVQSLFSAFEGTFLLMLSLIRYRWVFTALGSMRRQPFVALALVYTALFIFGFSAIANFGLLARERVQLLPFYLIFLSIPPPDVAIQTRYQP